MTANEIFEQITQTQESLRAHEDCKRQLELQLNDVNKSIMSDINTLDQLQEELDKALHAANVHAAEDGESNG